MNNIWLSHRKPVFDTFVLLWLWLQIHQEFIFSAANWKQFYAFLATKKIYILTDITYWKVLLQLWKSSQNTVHNTGQMKTSVHQKQRKQDKLPLTRQQNNSKNKVL